MAMSKSAHEIWFPMVNVIDPYLVRDLALTKLRMTQFLETNKTENNMERNLKLSVEQAQKLYAEQPTMRELLLTTFSEEELKGVVLKDWSELGSINSYWITALSDIKHLFGASTTPSQKNGFATYKQAKSSLAMAQLSQLMKDLGSECEVDWGNSNSLKRCITREKHKIETVELCYCYAFLAFNTAKVRDAFANKHERLIKDYFMLD